MSNTPLTDAELQEIKQRMGYPAMTRAAYPYMQLALIFETAVRGNVDDYGIGWIRNTILPQLRLIDTALGGDDLAFDKVIEVVGDVKLDMRQKMALAKARQRYWLQQLSTTIGVALGPHLAGGSGGASIVLC